MIAILPLDINLDLAASISLQLSLKLGPPAVAMAFDTPESASSLVFVGCTMAHTSCDVSSS